MFASTNLVIELGILILIFLGPEYLAAELFGGLVLIIIITLLIRLLFSTDLRETAREHAEALGGIDEERFDPWSA